MTTNCPKCGSQIRVPDDVLARGSADVTCPVCMERFIVEGGAEESMPPQGRIVKLESGKTAVVCPTCDKTFIISPEKIGPKPARTTCPSCKNPFVIILKPIGEAPFQGGIISADQLSKEYLRDKSESPTQPQSVSAPPPVDNGTPQSRSRSSYFVYKSDGARTGPFDLLSLQNAVAQGRLARNDIVEEPTGDIRPAGEIGGLIPAFEALRKTVGAQNDALQDIIAGILSGFGAGIALALLGLLTSYSLELGLTAVFARIASVIFTKTRNPLLVGFLVVAFSGLIIGGVVSAVKNIRKRKDEDYWTVSNLILICCIAGFVLGLFGAIFNGNIVDPIFGILEGAILGFVMSKIYSKIRPKLNSD